VTSQYDVGGTQPNLLGNICSNFVDYDNDGDLDIYYTRWGNFGQLFENKLNELGGFEDTAFYSGLKRPGNFAANTMWGDMNNDSFIDLFVNDYWYLNNLFLNNQNQQFTSAGEFLGAPGANNPNLFGKNGCIGDYNRDGLLDVFSGNRLYENVTVNTNHYLSVQLVGFNSNRTGIGVLTKVNHGTGINEQNQTRFIGGKGNLFTSGNLPELHFGLGLDDNINSLKIFWPSGIIHDITNISDGLDQLVRIPEETGDVIVDGELDILDTTLLVDYVLNPLNVPHEIQFFISDVVPDQNIDVLDIVALMNKINSLPREYFDFDEYDFNQPATISFDLSTSLSRAGDIIVPITIDSETPISILQMDIDYDATAFTLIDITNTDQTTYWEASYLDYGNFVRIVLWTMSSDVIGPGEETIFNLVLEENLLREGSATFNMRFDNVMLIAPGGVQIPFTIQGQEFLPTQYSLHHAYPNTFNPITTMGYDLPKDSKVSLIVYDMIGREVTQLVNSYKDAGYHTIQWDASSFASGVYMVKLVAGDFTAVQKIALVK